MRFIVRHRQGEMESSSQELKRDPILHFISSRRQLGKLQYHLIERTGVSKPARKGMSTSHCYSSNYCGVPPLRAI